MGAARRVFRALCHQRDSNQFVFSVLVNDTTENKFKYASFNQYHTQQLWPSGKPNSCCTNGPWFDPNWCHQRTVHLINQIIAQSRMRDYHNRALTSQWLSASWVLQKAYKLNLKPSCKQNTVEKSVALLRDIYRKRYLSKYVQNIVRQGMSR